MTSAVSWPLNVETALLIGERIVTVQLHGLSNRLSIQLTHLTSALRFEHAALDPLGQTLVQLNGQLVVFRVLLSFVASVT